MSQDKAPDKETLQKAVSLYWQYLRTTIETGEDWVTYVQNHWND